jgi:hypothetical protein
VFLGVEEAEAITADEVSCEFICHSIRVFLAEAEIFEASEVYSRLSAGLFYLRHQTDDLPFEALVRLEAEVEQLHHQTYLIEGKKLFHAVSDVMDTYNDFQNDQLMKLYEVRVQAVTDKIDVFTKSLSATEKDLQKFSPFYLVGGEVLESVRVNRKSFAQMLLRQLKEHSPDEDLAEIDHIDELVELTNDKGLARLASHGRLFNMVDYAKTVADLAWSDEIKAEVVRCYDVIQHHPKEVPAQFIEVVSCVAQIIESFKGELVETQAVALQALIDDTQYFLAFYRIDLIEHQQRLVRDAESIRIAVVPYLREAELGGKQPHAVT